MATLPRPSTKLAISNFDSTLDDQSDVCDLSRLTFIDAYGLVGTACALRVALAQDPELTIVGPANRTTAAHLTTMGLRSFLEDHGRSSLLPEMEPADVSDVVVPLRSASNSGGEQALSKLLWAQLRDHVDPSVLMTISEGVWEMVANALEHSGSDALIMAQVYWRKRHGQPPDHDDRVQVVIGDVGQGIRASFLATGVRQPATDLEAINAALEYLVSSVPDDPGRGQGLSTTMEQVIGLEGRMIVRSGTGKVSIDAEKSSDATVESVPGVLVAMSLPLYPG